MLMHFIRVDEGVSLFRFTYRSLRMDGVFYILSARWLLPWLSLWCAGRRAGGWKKEDIY